MDYLYVFITGGILCLIAQIIMDNTKLVSGQILVIYIVAGVILTALGLYEPIVRFGGAGATVPLTGFGYSLVKGTVYAVSQDGLLGVLTGPLTATAGGITAAIVFGYIFAVIFSPKTKK
ncbi:stage V sporulation protein AE [Anaerofustis sp.]|uniref:stage V sporulation protein AE n=1 Tax=Anaerofustis sp. TaxID=1872517 RepID=UPI0025BE17F4|nr:stage V sporulation protein AE [Anaerofustis sp.]